MKKQSLMVVLSLMLMVMLAACGGAVAPAPAPKEEAQPAQEEAQPAEEAAQPAEEEAQPAEEEAQPAEEEAAAPEDEQVELRIAWWGSQNRHDRTIAAIELYEQEHPNIKITYEFNGWEDHWTKLATQAAGGNLPDIIQQDYARIAEWQARDLLYPLDEFVEDGTLDFSNVSQSNIDGGVIDGQLWAVNLGTNSLGLALDVDAFAEAGVELPADDWTWKDFEDVCMALHEATGGF